DGLAAANAGAGVGVLVGGRSTVEDAYAYSKFARMVLGTNDIDFRARPHSAEETNFLASHVARHTDVTYADIEAAPSVLLVGLEPEDESPILFLRLRKGFRKNKTAVYSLAPFATRGLTKVGGTLIPAAPGTETEILQALAADRSGRAGDGSDPVTAAAAALSADSVILVGERLARVPGGLSGAAALAEATGARLAWVPRRAGERGAVEVGALPTLLPGGRPITDEAARDAVAEAWGTGLPAEEGRDTQGILEAAVRGELSALVVGGVDPDDLADPILAREALEDTFVVSLEFRESAVHEYADVILPVAPQQEKDGAYADWEGRLRTFERALSSNALSDHAVLDLVAAE